MSRVTTRSKWILVLLLFALLILAVHSPMLAGWVRRLDQAKQGLYSLGPSGWLAFMGIMAILIALGFPRLPLCAMAGTMYGAVGGLVLSQLGSLIGAYILFLIVRGGGACLVSKRAMRERNDWLTLMERNALWGVILARQLPVSGILVNAILGLSKIPHATFLFGSFIGFLPEGLIAVLLGSGVAKTRMLHSISQFALAVLVILSMIMLARVRRHGRMEQR